MLNPSQFAYLGFPINSELGVVENDLHRFLWNAGRQGNSPILITFNNPPPVLGKVDVGEMAAEGGRRLDVCIAETQSLLLRQMGVHLPIVGSGQRYRESLLSSYFLISSVCVSRVNTRSGVEYVLVTKNPEILTALSLQMSPSSLRQGPERYAQQFTTSYEELRSGSFNVVRLQLDVDGIRLGTLKVSTNSANGLLPFYSLRSYAERLFGVLSRHKVILKYRQEGKVGRIFTTLIPEIVSKYMGVSLEDAKYMTQVDLFAPTSFGYVTLPILSSRGGGDMVSLSMLDILQLQPAR